MSDISPLLFGDRAGEANDLMQVGPEMTVELCRTVSTRSAVHDDVSRLLETAYTEVADSATLAYNSARNATVARPQNPGSAPSTNRSHHILAVWSRTARPQSPPGPHFSYTPLLHISLRNGINRPSFARKRRRSRRSLLSASHGSFAWDSSFQRPVPRQQGPSSSLPPNLDWGLGV